MLLADAIASPVGGARLRPGRGEFIDIGGRRLRLVRAGPAAAQPLVLLECGAFGCAADWAVVQERLAARGLRSLAYDRAGLGYSDPGPTPRDGEAVIADLTALLAAAGETGPMVLVGHSMGGLFVRLFARRHPQAVLGVVLVDAVTPEIMEARLLAGAVHTYRGAMRIVGLGAGAGFMRPVALVIGDLIGLTGEASAEKRRIYGSRIHTRWAAEEVRRWPQTSIQARDAGSFDPALPMAVVTAGPERTRRRLKAIQAAPALASRHGYVDHVTDSNHANLLGVRFADPIVRGVEHVLAAAG
ncbi:alpha/beta hydrolase family protein [Phenylobacterium sp.]|uniref:alpha/beta fold hydrolase n=1 Tax=Phenylobacterium sp. TaxID=1871053 RepID=UPI002F42D45E